MEILKLNDGMSVEKKERIGSGCVQASVNINNA